MKLKRTFGIGIQTAPIWLTLLFSAIAVEGALGQNRGTVRVEENLRAEPQGVLLGRLLVGSTFPVLAVQGQWAQVDLQGWIWTRSVRVSDRQGFDLAVSVAPNENLRAEPSGAVLARLAEGALLERLDDRPGWTRVRRVAWVWAPSMELVEAGNPTSTSTAPGPRGAGSGEGWWRSGPGGAPVLTGPDGDTLALARPGAELQLLARQGNWVRVRLEGWSWAPLGEQTDSVTPGIFSDATPEEVTQDPETHKGQVVDWELQFISLEEAERVRTDFYEGEPFLLTRSTFSGRAFVYVAIPPERLAEVEGLIPLERIRVVGRIRAGAAALTGNPILDLLELTRISRR
ncbi:MAG: hypothetical protein ABIF09_03370 [Gemmatimonadota bacterium]